jgi:hypothetical protein
MVRREASAVEFLCVDCCYLKGDQCHHPAVADHDIDPVKGRVTTKTVPALSARSEQGLCGPEAALFYPPSERIVAVKSAWNGVRLGWAAAVAALMATAVAAQLLH